MHEIDDIPSPLIPSARKTTEPRPSMMNRRRWSYMTSNLDKDTIPATTYTTTTRATRNGLWRILSVTSASPASARRTRPSRTPLTFPKDDSSTDIISSEKHIATTSAAPVDDPTKSTTGSDWLLLSSGQDSSSTQYHDIHSSITADDFILVDTVAPKPTIVPPRTPTTSIRKPSAGSVSKQSLSRSISQPQRRHPPSTLQLPPTLPIDASGRPVLSPINSWTDTLPAGISSRDPATSSKPPHSLPFVDDRDECDPIIRQCNVVNRPVVVLRHGRHRSVAATIVTTSDESGR